MTVVYIDQYLTRFTVRSSKYNMGLISICRSYPKSFWDKELKFWSFPLDTLDSFLNELKSKGYEPEVTVRNPVATVVYSSLLDISVSLDQFVESFNTSLFEGSKYDRIKREFVIPIAYKEKLYEVLKQLGVEVKNKE